VSRGVFGSSGALVFVFGSLNWDRDCLRSILGGIWKDISMRSE